MYTETYIYVYIQKLTHTLVFPLSPLLAAVQRSRNKCWTNFKIQIEIEPEYPTNQAKVSITKVQQKIKGTCLSRYFLKKKKKEKKTIFL